MTDGPLDDDLRTGVVGLGAIGGSVVRMLDRRGRQVTAYDVHADAITAVPAQPADSPADIARASDVVVIAVVTADQVRDAMFGPDGIMTAARRGLVVVILSTIDVASVRDIARRAAEHEVHVLDCGVTMGERAAARGLVGFLGGPDDVVARTLPVLESFGERIVHCGPLGAGMTAKIARNVITYGTWTVVDDAVRLAEAGGVDPRALLEAIHTSDPDGSTSFRWLRMQLDGVDIDEARADRVTGLLLKDMAAAVDLADRHDRPSDLLALVADRGRATLAPGRPGRG